METNHSETVVEKTVNFVKDVLGIQHDVPSDVNTETEFLDTEPEVTAEQASSFDPNSFTVRPDGQVVPGGVAVGAVDPERSADDREGQRRPKSLTERNEDLVRRENGI